MSPSTIKQVLHREAAAASGAQSLFVSRVVSVYKLKNSCNDEAGAGGEAEAETGAQCIRHRDHAPRLPSGYFET